jgi:hypothetical protein
MRQVSSVLEAGTALPGDFLVDQDLVGVFQVGWTVLHHNVCMDTAERLIRILAHLRCDDRETQSGLRALRVEMTRQRKAGTPWRARDALEVITLLDTPAWSSLLGLLDECPVLPAALTAALERRTGAVSATDFEFISTRGQLAHVREFMARLPDTLRRSGGEVAGSRARRKTPRKVNQDR